ncbi:hypothetical protein D9Q98_004391 [Chlorella vulgaris]|uniref:Uncharacterized protein n=1 Tax=Chlorella vulgaris TaxID=3077 RepID=A0A9D4TPT0_CHLVU|nr:hypothetical protein D9Q98_004391 [Chlorella vulgaris]
MQAPAAARHADSPPLDASGQAQEAGHPSSRWIALFTHPGTVFKRSTPFWLDFSGISLCKRQEARLPCCPNVSSPEAVAAAAPSAATLELRTQSACAGNRHIART